MTPHTLINKGFIALLALATLSLLGAGRVMGANPYPEYGGRVFDLYLYNGTQMPMDFRVTSSYCSESCGCGNSAPGAEVGASGLNIPPNGFFRLTIARVQGHGCDGENGAFYLVPTSPGVVPTAQTEGQWFYFTNDGGMWVKQPNSFAGVLLEKNPNDGSYTWVFTSLDQRLSGPLDERLTLPHNAVAKNFGTWDGDAEDGGSTHWDMLEFRKNGFKGFDYHECGGTKSFHTQHIVRTPNKNGHAYFVVTNSDAYVPDEPFVSAKSNGYFSVYRTDLPPDPVTDIVPNNPGTDGEIVAEVVYDIGSEVGMWNHPCKMEMIGSVLVVSAQHYVGAGVCRWGDGDSQSVLFYDMRDPEHPKYWGKMSGDDLAKYGPGDGIPNTGKPPQESNNVTIHRQGDKYVLTAGWWLGLEGVPPFPGVEANNYAKSWISTKLSPNLRDWTYMGHSFVQAQHGGIFQSMELYDSPANVPPGTVNPGTLRTMFLDGGGGDRDNHVVGDEYLSFSDINTSTSASPKVGQDNWRYRAAPNLFPSTNDYDSCGPYVTPKGQPLVYAPLEEYPDCCGGNYGADKIYQLWHPANTSMVTPLANREVTHARDSGTGSLREAIAGGGHLTFAPSLDAQTINLTSGPLFVLLHDVQIDASSVPHGVTVNVPLRVADGFVLEMKDLYRTGYEPLGTSLEGTPATPLVWATGETAGWFDETNTTHNGASAAQSAPIGDSRQSDLQTAVTGPGTLTFWWKVSSEQNFDFLRFRLDGVLQGAATDISGNVDWQQKTISIPAGYHQLRWTYSKDGSVAAGSDAAWLDGVVFLPEAPQISGTLAASGKQGLRFSYQVSASGHPTSYTATGLPAGLGFNPLTGYIEGTAFASGTFNVTITASNAGGTSTPQILVLTIAPSTVTLREAVDLPDPAVPNQPDGSNKSIPFESYYISVPFFGESSTFAEGGDAAQSAPIGNNATSDMVTYFYGPGTLYFLWKVSSEAGHDFLRLNVGDVEPPAVPGISGNVNWQGASVNLGEGPNAVRWIYSKDGSSAAGTDAGWVDQVIFKPSLAQALDTPGITWTTSQSGSFWWFGQMDVTHAAAVPVPSEFSQRDAAQSGTTADLGQCTMETTVTGPATLTFWWKVSSEATYDFLHFYLDSVEQPGIDGISGEVDWVQKTVSIPAGSHNIRWKYIKDGSLSGGLDAGFVDQVILTPPHRITSSLAVNVAQGSNLNHLVTAANAATDFKASLDPITPYTDDRLPPGLSFNRNTHVLSGTPTVSGTFNINLSATTALYSSVSWWGESTATLVLTIGPSVWTNVAALETGNQFAANLVWTTGGDGNWYGQSAIAHSSVASRTSTIGNGQQTDLETTVTGPGVLSFYWKVSSEADHDFLRLTIDGTVPDGVPPISGEVDWQQQTVNIPWGEHVLRWTYVKDEANSAGMDAGFVDDVLFIPHLVTNTNDSGPGSLRQTLLITGFYSPAGGTVGFASDLSGATITLGGTQLSLEHDVIIDASQLPGGITVNGAGASRVFDIADGINVGMSGLKIIGGVGQSGGGIQNGSGTLQLTNVTVSGNTSNGDGGGISNNSGTLVILNSTFSGNSTTSWGGGISSRGTLVVANSTFSGNSATGLGGGISISSTSQNSSTNTLTNCTVSGNTAANYGGGLYTDGILSLKNCTVANNHATAYSGGVFMGSGPLNLENCIVADNTTTDQFKADIFKASGVITATGANLIGNNTSVSTEFPSGPLVGTIASPLSAHLATLGSYDGYTQTMPPMSGSPAIDAALATASTPTLDQRGKTRWAGLPADIGAVEIGPSVGVASLVDGGVDSLRKAIANADYFSTIVFDPSLSGQTITLGGDQLLVNRHVNIDASDLSGGVTVNGNNLSRVMEIAAHQDVTIANLKLTGGSADYGGAIRNNGTLSMEDCEVAGSTASNQGGGIYNYFGALALKNVTLAGNTSNGLGGGIWSAGGSVSLTNCTVQGNQATHHAGVVNENGAASLIHNTISGNIAGNGSGDGGGFSYLQFGSASLTFANNIVAGNLGNVGPDIYNNATFTPTGANFIGKNHTVTAQFPAGPLAGTSASPLNPLLAPLASYGGRTRTMPPLPGSPVIEKAVLLANTPTSDQRGNPRPAGPLPDIGAVEAGPFPLGSLADTDTDGIPDVLEGPGGPYPQFTVGVNDSTLDSDGDGSTDAQEIANMTNLHDGNDRLKPLAFGTAAGFDAVTNPLFNISFTTFPGVQYQLETSATLQGFQTLAGSTFTATSYISSFQVLFPPVHRFVRIKRL